MNVDRKMAMAERAMAGAFLEEPPMHALKELEETMRSLGAECAYGFADGEDPALVARTFAACAQRIAAGITAFVNK